MSGIWSLEHFEPHELLSPAGLHLLYDRNILMMQSSFLIALSFFRNAVDREFLANQNGLYLRGYRSPEENATIKNYTQFSRHVQGLAADITIRGWTVAEMESAARDFGFTFVKPYPEYNFVHIDLRSRSADTIITFIEEGEESYEKFHIKTTEPKYLH